MTKVKTTKAGGFEFDLGLPVPDPVRSARTSETAQKLAAMPVGASFLEEVARKTEIKDEAEREKIFKEDQRSTASRIAGAIRRFTTARAKDGDESYKFESRTVDNPELGSGVRVYRVAVDGKKAA